MNKTLKKTCVSCGQQKPLSAFLQLTGAQGSTYGNICSSCRKTALDKSKATKDREEGTTSSTTKTVDIKSKVKAEQDKRQQRRDVDERYREDREKNAVEERVQIRKKEGFLFEQKRYREGQLETRQTKEADRNVRPENTEVVGGETQRAREERVNLDVPFIDTQIAGKLNKGEGYRRLIAFLPDSSPIKQAAKRAAGQLDKTPENGPDHVKKTWGPKSK